MKHRVKHLRFPEAPVEAVTEFRQVTRQVFWADTMVDTTNIALILAIKVWTQGMTLGVSFPKPGTSHSWR